MTPPQPATQPLQKTAPKPVDERQKLEKTLLGQVGRAIRDWKLIEDGDRIMVGISGGKDSYTLMHLLSMLQKRAPIKFELIAVNLDQGQPGFPAHLLKEYFEAQGYDYRILVEDTYSIVTDKIPEGRTYCSLCSRLRRGVLYDAAVELGCSKIALGHHRDDLLETLLLNLFFSGQLKAMPAKLLSDDGRNTVIRPLVYSAEVDIARYSELMDFPVVPCNLCGAQPNMQRQSIKALLQSLEEQHPYLKSSMLNALQNVRPTHLLDPALAKSGSRSHGGTEEIARALGLVDAPQGLSEASGDSNSQGVKVTANGAAKASGESQESGRNPVSEPPALLRSANGGIRLPVIES